MWAKPTYTNTSNNDVAPPPPQQYKHWQWQNDDINNNTKLSMIKYNEIYSFHCLLYSMDLLMVLFMLCVMVLFLSDQFCEIWGQATKMWSKELAINLANPFRAQRTAEQNVYIAFCDYLWELCFVPSDSIWLDKNIWIYENSTNWLKF